MYVYIYIYLDPSSTWIKTGEITDRLLLNTFVEHLEGLNIYYIGGSKHILYKYKYIYIATCYNK